MIGTATDTHALFRGDFIPRLMHPVVFMMSSRCVFFISGITGPNSLYWSREVVQLAHASFSLCVNSVRQLVGASTQCVNSAPTVAAYRSPYADRRSFLLRTVRGNLTWWKQNADVHVCLGTRPWKVHTTRNIVPLISSTRDWTSFTTQKDFRCSISFSLIRWLPTVSASSILALDYLGESAQLYMKSCCRESRGHVDFGAMLWTRARK